MRVPAGFVMLVDAEGVRHSVRATAIQVLSDADACRDSTVAVIGGRMLLLPKPLDEVIAAVETALNCQRPVRG